MVSLRHYPVFYLEKRTDFGHGMQLQPNLSFQFNISNVLTGSIHQAKLPKSPALPKVIKHSKAKSLKFGSFFPSYVPIDCEKIEVFVGYLPSPTSPTDGVISSPSPWTYDMCQFHTICYNNVRPPLNSVQLVNITPISLWFMVRK
jgi:hypothetical protein